MKRDNSDNYRQIFLSDSPLVDLRSPSEFSKGAFPNAVNYPLMNDEERRLIGICYKQHGQQKAIELGHQLVCGETKGQRVESWNQFAKQNLETGFLYCFRGGLRSKISQQWLSESGMDLPIISGGYKDMRQFLIQQTKRIVEESNIYVLTGLTGTAKTKLIVTEENAIDLEGLANHRGSSFGKRVTPQPNQINFENQLAIQLLKYEAQQKPFLLLEDESRLIGSRSSPLELKEKMDISCLIMIEESFDYRIEQIHSDYVVKMMNEFEQVDKERAFDLYNEYLVGSVSKIKKRLGGVDFKETLNLIGQAIKVQKENNDLSKHKDWIVYLLNKYYDPMYAYQFEKKIQRIMFKGNTEEVKNYIRVIKKESM